MIREEGEVVLATRPRAASNFEPLCAPRGANHAICKSSDRQVQVLDLGVSRLMLFGCQLGLETFADHKRFSRDPGSVTTP